MLALEWLMKMVQFLEKKTGARKYTSKRVKVTNRVVMNVLKKIYKIQGKMTWQPGLGHILKGLGMRSITVVWLTHTTWALSSGEAELHAIGTGILELMWAKNFLQGNSVCLKSHLIIETDSTVGKTISMRLGASREARHIDLQLFYLQSLAKHGLVSTMKAPSAEEVADYMIMM